ncbi:MAG: glycosyltransferase [Patescibacteria group bacterium]
MINKFFYRKGGSEAYMFDLLELLKKAGHEVVEFSMKDEKNQASKYSDFFIDKIDFNKRQGFLEDLKKAGHLIYSFEAKRKLEALIKKAKPDIAHLHNFSFQLTPSILQTLKKYNIPIVWTMHDYKLICPNYRLFTQGSVCERCKVHKYYNCWKYKCIKNNSGMSFLAMLEMYLHKLILRSYEKIDCFIAPSKFLEAKVLDWGINEAKVKQLYHLLDLEKLNVNPEIGEGLLYFGRLAEEKGLKILLEAMKDLPNIKLKIVGAGPQKQELQNYIAGNNLNNVEIVSHKTGSELYDLIKNARLVVVPSIWYENNPISILEAFAFGKPVIGSNLGGIPELVRENKTGFLFTAGNSRELKNKIAQNYNKAEELKIWGANARQLVASISNPADHLQSLLDLYQKLIKK